MAGKKSKNKPRGTLANPPKRTIDLSDVTLKQIAALMGAVAVLVSAVWTVGLWFFRADHSHSLNSSQEPRIVRLEETDAQYDTMWADAIAARKQQIAEQQAFFELYKDRVSDLD